MKILTINAGSSSLKFTIFNIEDEAMLASGQVERIGLKDPRLLYKRADGVKCEEKPAISSYIDAVKIVCDKLVDKDVGVLKDLSEVKAIGHRVVHGGEKMTKPVLIDAGVRKVIKDCFSLAPLHNPPNMTGIEACEQIFPGVPNVAVFDTAFHQSMPPEAYLYAIPLETYKQHGVRRYGFHGTSHHFVANSTAKFLGKPLESLKLITCHFGNGCSMAAVDKGKVADTTMGMTPLEGLVMGTRCGDIDPAVVLRLIGEMGMSPAEVDTFLNKKCGLLGVAGINSSDMRDIINAADGGNEQAGLALKIFVRRIVKYIGAYAALLNGADAVVFTGGIGEYSAVVRAKILDYLGGLGLHLDKEANEACKGRQGIISTSNSSWKAIVTPTNEELMIGLQSYAVLKEKKLL